MKVLVTGASGLLGWRTALELAGAHSVTGTFLAHPIEIPRVAMERCDLLDLESAHACLCKTRPQVVVHTAAQANVDACERDPAAAERANVLTTRHLVEASRRAGVRQLIYISTDFAFDGARGAYSEEDDVRTVNVYAATKMAGEREALGHPGHLILRTSIFGWNVQAKHSLAERVIAADTTGATLGLYSDSFSNALDTGSYAGILAAAIDRDWRGLLHVGSQPPTSKLFFGLLVARVFGLRRVKIEARSLAQWNEVRTAGLACRPHDTSLCTVRARALMPMPSILACITRMKGEIGLFERTFGRKPGALEGR